MDNKISLKNPQNFFDTNMFIDYNDMLCQNKEEDMFEEEILDNYIS